MSYAQGDMKGLNRRTVFDMIAHVGEVSRVDLGSKLGISSPTVLKITNFLMERGIIKLAGEEKTARGRRPQLLRFDPDSLIGIGVDYNGTEVKAAACNYWGQQKGFTSRAVSGDFDDLMENVMPLMLEELIRECGVKQENVWGVGICLPGAVDTAMAHVELGALSEISIRRPPKESVRLLTNRGNMPVYLFNDVNAAATGEYVLRKMPNEQDLVYITVGNGVGAGIILDGKLRTGKHFYTGEIAHIVFDPHFVTKINSPGWFEAKLAKEQLQQCFPAGKESELVDYLAKNLALAIANICNLLDVQTVILGGERVEKLEPELLQKTQEYATRLCMFDVRLHRPSCRYSSIVGASSMALGLELETVLADSAEL